MKKKRHYDKRVKSSLFPISIFVFTLIGFALFSTGQMRIIGEYMDVSEIPLIHAIAIPAMWVMAANLFTWMTAYQINKRYQKPIEDFARATRKVASGDFSVYMAPKHTPDKADHLDVIFTDFNKMVEELGSIRIQEVGAYKKVESAFVNAFLEEIKDDDVEQPADETTATDTAADGDTAVEKKDAE